MDTQAGKYLVDKKLNIAKELIEILAKGRCSSPGSGLVDGQEYSPAKRIIEAARRKYVLPSFCAEMNDEAVKCIECIVDYKTPAVCSDRDWCKEEDELDVAWDNKRS